MSRRFLSKIGVEYKKYKGMCPLQLCFRPIPICLHGFRRKIDEKRRVQRI
jgi:hypothetical protein